MLTLGEFKTLLRRAHKRGSALDDDLNPAIRRAAKFIEQNYTLQYMRRRFTIELEPGTDEIAIPNVNIKAFLSPIRWNAYDSTGEWAKCRKISFDDVSAFRSTSNEIPSEFYLDGTSTIVFPALYTGVESYVGTGMLARFSDFPIEDDESHWLIENGESALLNATILELGLISRDDRIYDKFQQHLLSHLTVMLNADTEAQYAGQDISL